MKNSTKAFLLGFLALSGLKLGLDVTAENVQMVKYLNSDTYQSDTPKVNMFNVYDVIKYEVEPYQHEVLGSYIYPSKDMIDYVPVPEGYEIKSYNISEVNNGNGTKYLYNVIFTNSVTVEITGQYNKNEKIIDYECFGKPLHQSRSLKKGN
jgi:hypothetical protein